MSINLFKSGEISQLRKKIKEELAIYGLTTNLNGWDDKNLREMYNLYDKYFFNNEISQTIKETGSSIKFQTTSGKKAKIGGWCRTEKLTPQKKTCTFTISFPKHMYISLFTDPNIKSLKNNGVICYDRLDCLQLTFEHELVHLIMQLYGQYKEIKGPGKMIYTSHGKLFQCFTKSYFGHTDFRHSLGLGEASEQLSPKDAFMGMKVSFKFKNDLITGKIIKLNKKSAKIQELHPVNTRLWKTVPYPLLKSEI